MFFQDLFDEFWFRQAGAQCGADSGQAHHIMVSRMNNEARDSTKGPWETMSEHDRYIGQLDNEYYLILFVLICIGV